MKKILMALLTSLCVSTSFAMTPDNVTDYCSNYARYVYQVAQARNANIDRLQLKDQVKIMINEKKNSKFNMDEFPELSRIIDIVYFRPDVTAEYASQTYFQHCVSEHSES